MDSLFVTHYARLVIVSDPGPAHIWFWLYGESSVPVWQLGGFEP